jgi:ribosomal protein S5
MSAYHDTIAGAQMLAVAQAPVVVAEFSLNRHESIRAEIIQRRGKSIVAISRWKQTSGLPRRTGSAIEFAAHRTAGIANLLSDLQGILNSGVSANAVEAAGPTVASPASAWRRP